MQGSANLNVMIKAARKAGRSLVKDFQEVENLQVSMKGPGDFVSKADIAAENIIRTELSEARPTYGWLAEESGETPGKGSHPALDCRPAGRHHKLPAWAATLGSFYCARTQRPDHRRRGV